jgi:hypothetical protein
VDILGPARYVAVHDYSIDPRVLLRTLADDLLALRTEQWLPVLHVRRHWLHGAHLAIVARPLSGSTLSLDDFTTRAASCAEALAASAPATPEYLRRAEQLAQWERTPPPYLPVYPQGRVHTGTDAAPADWPPALVRARDQILSRMLEPTLRSARLDSVEPTRHATRLLAALAASHRYGEGVGTLSYRSHAEAFCAIVGGAVDLRATFASRLAADRDVFRAALAGDPADLSGAEADALRDWAAAFEYAWGAAEALAVGGYVDEHLLDRVGAMTSPFGRSAPSTFHQQLEAVGMATDPPYWQVAHRLVTNCLYTSLTCLGITPVQRYYLCFGLSEAVDERLGETWLARIGRLSADRALAKTTANTKTAA